MAKFSPENSDSDADSEATLEEFDLQLSGCEFGYPLERVRAYGIVDDDESRSDQACTPGYYSNPSASSSVSDFSATSSVAFDIDFEALVDVLVTRDPSVSEAGSLTIVEPSENGANDSIMIKCLPLTSTELVLLLELNHPDIRSDPWNPAPHILCAVERDDNVYLCLQRLIEIDQPPFRTVANYIDLFRQTLEGLTFLHEHKIAQLSCSDPRSLMVDIGVCPSTTDQFDRALFPVRYYYVNFSKAERFRSTDRTQFQRDVKDCSQMIDRMLIKVPRVSAKLKALVKAMSSGEFGADDSRKLLDALCKSLDASVFDLPVPVSGDVQ